MRDPRQDYVGLETPDQVKEAEGSGADPGSAQGVDSDPGWKRNPAGAGARNQSQVQVVLFAGEAARQQSDNLLRSSSAQMRDEQEYSDAPRDGVFLEDG